MKKGTIYIFSNKIFHNNLLKIGMTKFETLKRKSQLSASTSIPEEFDIEGSFDFYDITNVEKEIHNELKEYRYKKNKEFFTCEIITAKNIILNAQVKDHKKFIASLLKTNENLLSEINSIVNVTEKWKIFFSNLNWRFSQNHEKQKIFDIELFIKKYDFIENGEVEIVDSKALIKIVNVKDFEEVDKKIINEIEELELKDNRLFILLNKPIIDFYEVYLGYEFKNQSWEKIRIINYDSRYGLFDEDRTYFDYLNGRFPERKDLFFADKGIMTKWI